MDETAAPTGTPLAGLRVAFLVANEGIEKVEPPQAGEVHNSGAEWVDEEVRVGGRLVSRHHPHDLPASCTALVDVFAGATTSR